MATIKLKDLTEEAKKRVLEDLASEANKIFAEYQKYDDMKSKKWIGWYYRMVSVHYWNEWREYMQFIDELKQNDNKDIAYVFW